MKMLPAAAVCACAVLLAATPARAQEDRAPIYIGANRGPDVHTLPRDVADDVIRFFNAPGTIRFSGLTQIPAARGIDGDVAVLGGSVTLGGRVSGSLYVINGDLTLEPGAIVGGDVLVVGGVVLGARDASVAGEVRTYRDVLRYRRDGDEIVYAPRRTGIVRWRRSSGDEGLARFVVGLGGTYNRVEGAPIGLGPRLNIPLGEGSRLTGDARLVVRTGENFSLENGRFGYRVRGEYVLGSRVANVGFGARAFDQVASVEPWPMRDYEAGWAAFLLHNDYRDWYRRRGYGLYAALRPSRDLSLTIEGRQENDFSANVNDPWTLFNSSESWRPNPAITDGHYKSLVTSLRVDTRNDRTEPSSGVFLNAEFEVTRGTAITGTVDPFTACPAFGPCTQPGLADGNLTYQRAWFDGRAFLQVTPAGRIGVRLAGGGWMGGDPLPLQRRVSLGFPDPLPGYAFRAFSCGGAGIAGSPALCDRAVVAQVELRTHLGFDFGPEWANDWGDNDDDRWEPFHVSGPDIVVFADAGYAWSVASGPNRLPSDRLPSLSLWQPDLGVGLDLGPIGAYLAKSIGPASQAMTFSVRMGRRF